MDTAFPSSRIERQLLRELIQACHSEPTERFEHTIYPKLRKLVPHEMFMYGRADAHAHICRHVNMSFPQEYLDQVSAPAGGLDCPMIGNWLRIRQPLYWDWRSVCRPSAGKSKHYQAFRDLGIGNIAVHGLMEARQSTAGCYALARMADPWNPRYTTILSLVIPHVHFALTPRADREPIDNLSPRELDVLYWLVEGKTDTAIAALLGISIYTVRIHVQNIIHKLGADNRTHAVAQAFRFGLVRL